MPAVKRKATADDKSLPAKKVKAAAGAASHGKTDESSSNPLKSDTKTGRISVGQKVPGHITVQTDAGDSVSIESLLEERGAVIFIYPKANTPGCTKQACAFRDHFMEFEDLGYQVFGLSMDSPKSQSSWKKKKEFKYTLLCDPKQLLIKALGASKNATSVIRSHFVLQKGGRLLDAKLGVKPDASTPLALEFIKEKAS